MSDRRPILSTQVTDALVLQVVLRQEFDCEVTGRLCSHAAERVRSTRGMKDDSGSCHAAVACRFQRSFEHDDGNVVGVMVRCRAFARSSKAGVGVQTPQEAGWPFEN